MPRGGCPLAFRTAAVCREAPQERRHQIRVPVFLERGPDMVEESLRLYAGWEDPTGQRVHTAACPAVPGSSPVRGAQYLTGRPWTWVAA